MSQELTSSQKTAAFTRHSRTLVSAGAGTGKTRVIVERIRYLIVEKGVRLSEMLVLTFTEKAANELKKRLLELFSEMNLKAERQELESAYISTFHAFASRLLKEHPIEAGVDPDFRVLESQESDFLKEDVFVQITEELFLNESNAFNLYKTYGEDTIQRAVMKLHAAVVHDGGDVASYFKKQQDSRREVFSEVETRLLKEAHELAAPIMDDLDQPGWDGFLSKENWDWETYNDFKAWLKPYARKGKPREAWKAWRDFTKVLASSKIEHYSREWEEGLVEIVEKFTKTYEDFKAEKNVLDFDDLQAKAVALFQDPHPACQRICEKYEERLKYVFIDEFQDTNRPQVHFAGALERSNKFLVGDYKQSIYAFRGAEPGIFFDLSESWGNSDQAQKVVLSDNFRTSAAVLEFVNLFFESLWDEDDFYFDALVPKGDLEPFSEKENVELIAVEVRKEDGGIDQARFEEAFQLAGRLKELHDEGVPYGEMTLLFEAMTKSHIYEYALREYEIPYVSISGSGFYQQSEVKDVLSFLELIDNPYADIPLAAVLRSPFGFVSDTLLYRMAAFAKKADKTAPLYAALENYEQLEGVSEAEQKRLVSFSDFLCQMRNHKDQYSVSELIQELLHRSSYELWALSQRDGVRKFANLKKLIELAREAEAHERISLHQFVKMMKRLQLKEVREGMAQIDTEESRDAVRLMTVHASKGLEFSVVAIADMGHQKSSSESRAVLTSSEEGYALRLKNNMTRDDEKPYFYLQLEEKLKAEAKMERKRLLYVAMTRAKHKLLLSGVYTPKKETKKTFSEMQTWMEWVLSLQEDLPLEVIELKRKQHSHEKKEVVFERAERILNFSDEMGEKNHEVRQQSQEWVRQVSEPLTRQLPKVIDLPVSAYMSYLKNPDEFRQVYQLGRLLHQPDEMKDREKFEQPEMEMHVSDIGTAVHGILEVMDFNDPQRFYDAEYLKNFFYDEKSLSVAKDVIQKFTEAPFFKELEDAKTLKREAEFVYNARHGLIYGAVDALVQNQDGDWAILDYKTSEGDASKTKKYFYDLQIQMYALAANDILRIPVTRGLVYYLKNQEVVEIPIEDFDAIRAKVNDLQSEILRFYYE